MIKPSIISWPISKRKHCYTFPYESTKKKYFPGLICKSFLSLLFVSNEWNDFFSEKTAMHFLCFKGPKILYVKIAEAEAFARWRMENLHEKAVGKQSINKPIEDLIFSIFI